MDSLKQIEEFKASPELIKKLNEFGVLKKFDIGDTILSEESYISSIPIIVKGLVRVIRTEEDGRELLLYYLKSGESCIMSFLGGIHNERSKVRVEVEEEAEILFIPVTKISQFIDDYPQWLDYIFKLYHKRFEELLEIVNAISFKKVDERLLDLLNKKMDLTGSKDIIITHEQLANELGTARVVISRLLKTLENEGRVKLGRNKITIL